MSLTAPKTAAGVGAEYGPCSPMPQSWHQQLLARGCQTPLGASELPGTYWETGELGPVQPKWGWDPRHGVPGAEVTTLHPAVGFTTLAFPFCET